VRTANNLLPRMGAGQGRLAAMLSLRRMPSSARLRKASITSWNPRARRSSAIASGGIGNALLRCDTRIAPRGVRDYHAKSHAVRRVAHLNPWRRRMRMVSDRCLCDPFADRGRYGSHSRGLQNCARHHAAQGAPKENGRPVDPFALLNGHSPVRWRTPGDLASIFQQSWSDPDGRDKLPTNSVRMSLRRGRRLTSRSALRTHEERRASDPASRSRHSLEIGPAALSHRLAGQMV